ncbi:MAG: hypothetical protein K1X89_24540 [Myxococcaceae bacterium]|nr:hypothetical protein [Myxococcaceae bacterium]
MLSAQQAWGSCLLWTCFCLEPGESDLSGRASALATLEVSVDGTDYFRVKSVRGDAGVNPGDLVLSESRPGDAAGVAKTWVLFFTHQQLRHQQPVTWAGTVSCQQTPKPVWLTVQRAQELFERPDCFEQLQSAGLEQGPCNDTSRLCFGSQSSGGVMVGLAALWLRRRRARTPT